MCGWTGHIQGNLPLRVCEAARPSARFSGKFCPQGNIRGKEFLSRDCAQKWIPPKRCVSTGPIPGRDFLFYFWRKRVRKTSRTKGPQ